MTFFKIITFNWNHKVISKHQGFTLVELLVVVSIFSLTALLATTVFSNIQTTQRGILSRQRTVADGRFIMETVTRTFKLGLPDYSYYESNACVNGQTGASNAPCNLSQPQSYLAVVDQTNTTTCYRWDPTTKKIATNSTCTAVTGWSDITPNDLQIDNFNILIRPVANPFRSPPTSNGDCQPTSITPPAIPQTGFFNSSVGACGCDNDATNECYSGQSCVAISDLVSACSSASPDQCICINTTNAQPTLTLFLKTTSTNTFGAPVSTTLQTTVTSRVFRR